MIDSQIPPNCMPSGHVIVEGYLRPDGTAGTCTSVHGEVQFSHALGMFVIGILDVYTAYRKAEGES